MNLVLSNHNLFLMDVLEGKMDWEVDLSQLQDEVEPPSFSVLCPWTYLQGPKERVLEYP